MFSEDRPLTADELSAATGIPLGTLRYWRHCGEGPRSYTVGKRVRYDPADVRDWFEAQKSSTARGGVA